MGLSHLIKRRETVSTPDGDIVVRGLNSSDVGELFTASGPALSALFEHLRSSDDGLVLDDMGAFAVRLVQTAPTIVAHIIARAADEPDVSLAADLPFPVQVDCLERIAALTFYSEAAAKKFLETVTRLIQGARSAVPRIA